MDSAHIAISPERCRDLLNSSVDKLLANTTQFPFNLGRLCSQLGVSLIYKEGISRFNAYIANSGRNWETAAVFLPTEGFGSSYERFCIAHELGHLLLFRELDARPEGGSDYWRFEELCDEFARKLLVPEDVVKDHLCCRDPISALKSSLMLARVSKVPWIHAARRISEFQSGVYFLRLTVAPSKRIKVLASSFPNQKERGRLIDEPTEFSKVLRSLSAGQPWEPVYVPFDLLNKSNVPSLLESLEAATCPRQTSLYTDAYLAVTN
jgi:Zn-dependent peptidase ImmA (M78 family)